MIGDTWIEIHTRLKEHPKTYALMTELKIKKPMAIGLLVCLWLWAIDNVEDGDLTPYPDEAISKAAEWDKRPKLLIDALIKCGWIDRDSTRTVLHDWSDYAGRLSDQRQQARDRAEKSRKRKRTVRAPCAQHSRDVSAECAPTVPYHTVPTKLRDNKQLQRYTGDCAHTRVEPTPPPKPEIQNLAKILKRWETAFSAFPSPIFQDKLKAMLKAGMSPDVIIAAIEETAMGGAQSPQKYAVTVLQSWYAAGVRDGPSLDAHKAREKANVRGAPKHEQYTVGEDGVKRDSAGFAVL